MAQDRRGLRVGDSDRDAVIEVLQHAYGNGRLTLDEYRARQDVALEAVFADDLRVLIDDLPEQSALPASALVAARPNSTPTAPTRPATSSIAVMSGRTIELEAGSRGFNGLAFMGGDDIYVRDALGPGVTITLTLNAIMGGSNVYVPPGVRVIDESVAIMAGNGIKAKAQGDGSQGTLILRGFLFWGGNDVKPDKRPQSAGRSPDQQA